MNLPKISKITRLLVLGLTFGQAYAQTYNFDNLSTGGLDGQNGWTAPEWVTVVENPTGVSDGFSGNVLSISTNREPTWTTISRPIRTITAVSFDFRISSNDNHEEAIWIRLTNRFGNQISVLRMVTEDIVEAGGGAPQNRLPTTIALDQIHHVDVFFNVHGGIANSAEIYFNNEFLGALSDISTNLALVNEEESVLQVRAWNCEALIDNLELTSIAQEYGPGVFNAYESNNNWCETEEWLGLIYAKFYPLVYLQDHESWGYVDEDSITYGGGWVYVLSE